MTQYYNHEEELLLIIDPQNVYLPDAPWACPSLPDVTKQICQILDQNKNGPAILTQFLAPEHPAGRWDNYNKEYKDINVDEWLSEIIAPFPQYDLPVVTKSTYSSLRDPQILAEAMRYGRIVLTGVVAECCVLATMMDAIDHGIHVVYLTDCISGQSPETEQQMEQLARSFEPVHTLVIKSSEYYK